MLSSLLLSGIFYGSVAAVVAFFLSPLQYLKVIRQETGNSYKQIFLGVSARKYRLKVLFRAAVPYMVMNFLSNMSFGIGDSVSYFILGAEGKMYSSVLLRSGLGGLIETVFTIYPETKEIEYNKGRLAKTMGSLKQIALPAYFRNTLSWVGAALGYELSKFYCIGFSVSVILSFVLGILFAILSIPFDVVTTQNCGSLENLGTIKRLKLIAADSKSMLFSGSFIRILQISIFTIVTVLTMSLTRSLNI